MVSSLTMSSAIPHRLFAICCGISVLFWWSALTATFALATSNDAYTHILLIVPVSVTLIILEWKKQVVRSEPDLFASGRLLGVAALIGVGVLQWRLSSHFANDGGLAIRMAALVAWWIACFTLCFGASALRRCWFALLFLFWLVPMPAFALNHIVAWLQEGTASVARILFMASGVPVGKSGPFLSIPGVSVEVAQECSSIRSSMILIVTSMVMAYTQLHSWQTSGLVMLAAVPLAIAKNGLRVFILVMLAAYVDPSVLKSRLHHQGGVLFFAAALAVVAVLISLFARVERSRVYPGNMRFSSPSAG
jgi:exosortase